MFVHILVSPARASNTVQPTPASNLFAALLPLLFTALYVVMRGRVSGAGKSLLDAAVQPPPKKPDKCVTLGFSLAHVHLEFRQ